MVKDLCVSGRSCKILPLFFKSLWPGASAGWAFFMFFFYTVKTEIIETGARTLELPLLVRSVVSAEG